MPLFSKRFVYLVSGGFLAPARPFLFGLKHPGLHDATSPRRLLMRVLCLLVQELRVCLWSNFTLNINSSVFSAFEVLPSFLFIRNEWSALGQPCIFGARFTSEGLVESLAKDTFNAFSHFSVDFSSGTLVHTEFEGGSI